MGSSLNLKLNYLIVSKYFQSLYVVAEAVNVKYECFDYYFMQTDCSYMYDHL